MAVAVAAVHGGQRAGRCVRVGIGYFLVDTLGAWLVHGYGLETGLARFQALFREYGALIILIKGLTPIPYKLVTIASGMAHYPLPAFIFLSAITRGLRFVPLAAVMRFLRPQARAYVERNLLWFMLGFLIIAGAGSALALKSL